MHFKKEGGICVFEINISVGFTSLCRGGFFLSTRYFVRDTLYEKRINCFYGILVASAICYYVKPPTEDGVFGQ